MGPRPNLVYEYRGFTPPHGWRVVREKLEALDQADRLQWSKSGVPYLVRYLDEQKGEILDNLWTDTPPVNSHAAERLGYQTQKPEALLERIMQASSNEGGLVLDPFCGCGTTINVAILTVEDILNGGQVIYPRFVDAAGSSVPTDFTYKRARRQRKARKTRADRLA